MAGKLKQLRKALDTLQSYNLPSQFVPHDPSSTKIKKTIDSDLISRYEKAKSLYLQQRITELLVEHVATFDGTSFQFPPLPDISILEKQKNDEDHVCKKMKRSADKLADKLDLLHADYESFRERRNELQLMVDEMQAKNEESHHIENNDVTNDINKKVTDEDEENYDGDDAKLAEQEEKYMSLVRKRMALQSKLERMKEEKRILENKHTNLNQTWEGMKENCTKYLSDSHAQTLKNIIKDRDKMKTSISQLKEKAAWYKSVTEAFEELGGIKIISVKDGVNTGVGSNKSIENARKKDLMVHFLLMDKYLLDVTLSPVSKIQKKQTVGMNPENLVISHVNLSTQAKLIDGIRNDEKFIQSHDHTVTLPLPSLSDILPVAHTLSPNTANNLRFLLRETLSRLHATESRAEELSILRTKYLTKVMKSGHEVVCSLDEGVTVRICLTPDCPITMGSAYVEEMVGIGGWCEETLDELKTRVNRKINSGEFGCAADGNTNIPSSSLVVSVMDLVVKELGSLKKPGTPKLPMRKKK